MDCPTADDRCWVCLYSSDWGRFRWGCLSCWPDTTVWASAITQLNPHYVQLDKTETGRPKIRLTWGGALGHWGVEIGPADMAMPRMSDGKSNGEEEDEYRLPLAPGAYVWHEL